MPRVMKGLEKSTAFSLSYVMDRSAIARSAFCKQINETLKWFIIKILIFLMFYLCIVDKVDWYGK